MELIKVINNISERVIDDLKTKLSKGSRVSIAAASFSIYAFEALKEELENVDELRLFWNMRGSISCYSTIRNGWMPRQKPSG
ncbi:MAG: hypothetical protein V8T35_13025 [Prevotella sp.]